MSGGGAPARFVSVSELYGGDEVELLLEEIRSLEPTACRGEELADCEIAGSGAARSPAPTERSWDSHAVYARALAPPVPPLVPLLWRPRVLLRPAAALSLLVAVCSWAACGCVWAAGGPRARPPPAPPGPLRLLALAALSSALLHSTQLAARVAGLPTALPLRWDLLMLWTSAWSGASLCAGGAALSAALSAAPPPALAVLASAAALGLCGALASFILLVRACVRAGRAHRPAAPGSVPSAAPAPPRAHYRAVPAAPPRPSTSRDRDL